MGAFSAYLFFNSDLSKEITSAYNLSHAVVNQSNGLYIFIESKPLNLEKFEVIKVLKDQNVETLFKNLKNHKGTLLEKILDGVSSVADPKQKLDMLTKYVKENFPEAKAIVLTNGFRNCEVLKIKD